MGWVFLQEFMVPFPEIPDTRHSRMAGPFLPRPDDPPDIEFDPVCPDIVANQLVDFNPCFHLQYFPLVWLDI